MWLWSDKLLLKKKKTWDFVDFEGYGLYIANLELPNFCKEASVWGNIETNTRWL